MEKLRLSLAIPTEPRSSKYLDKDASMTNAYIDIDPLGNAYTVKRPGFLMGLEGITTGTVRGIYWNPTSNNKLAVVNQDNTLTFYDYLSNGRFGVLWSSGTTYNIGDGPIYYDDGSGNLTGPWFPAAKNTNVIPSLVDSPGNIIWSPTPFTEERYYGVYRGLSGPTCATKEAAGYTAWAAHEPFKVCGSTPTWYIYAFVAPSPPLFPSLDVIWVSQWVDQPPFNCSNPRFHSFANGAGNGGLPARVITL